MLFSKLLRVTVMTLLLSAISLGSLAHASSPANDQEKIVAAVPQMFVALGADDTDLFNSVTSKDFYAFDVGNRFTAEALVQLVKNAHASGKVYGWEVTDPEVHIDGNSALITYVNRGSIKDSTGVKEMSWLESAVLRKKNGAWRIHFFHSTRVPAQ